MTSRTAPLHLMKHRVVIQRSVTNINTAGGAFVLWQTHLASEPALVESAPARRFVRDGGRVVLRRGKAMCPGQADIAIGDRLIHQDITFRIDDVRQFAGPVMFIDFEEVER